MGAGAALPPPAAAPVSAAAGAAAAVAPADAADAAAAGGGVLVAGLCCLDLLLHGATPPVSPEAIASYSGATYVAGGGAPNTATSLAGLGVTAAIVGAVGDDGHGRELGGQLAAAGVDTAGLAVMAPASGSDGGGGTTTTALAVVPVFVGGGRGCYVDLGANALLDGATLGAAATAAAAAAAATRAPPTVAFHLAYPHLLPRLQGADLAAALAAVRAALPAALLSVDLNGVAAPDAVAPVLPPAALAGVALLHANLDEALTITDAPGAVVGATMGGGGGGDGNTGAPLPPPHPLLTRPDRPTEASVTGADLAALAAWFHARGVGVVAITLGAAGAYIAAHPDDAVVAATTGGRLVAGAGAGVFPAFAAAGAVNGTGAGDAFAAGLLAAAVAEPHGGGGLRVAELATSGLAAALARVDGARAGAPPLRRRHLLASLRGAPTLPLPLWLGGGGGGGGSAAAAAAPAVAAIPVSGVSAIGAVGTAAAAPSVTAAAAAASEPVAAAYVAAAGDAARAAHPALGDLAAPPDGVAGAVGGGGGAGTGGGAAEGRGGGKALLPVALGAGDHHVVR